MHNAEMIVGRDVSGEPGSERTRSGLEEATEVRCWPADDP